MAAFGDLMLGLAAALSALAVGLCASDRGRRALNAARAFLYAAAAAGVVSVAALLFLLVTQDYSIAYVRDYADRTMSFGYLVTALWGGQEGSLTLWAVLQTLFTAAAARWSGRLSGESEHKTSSVALIFLGGLQIYFLLLVLFHSNPFEILGTEAARGIGLNPLLRNPYMAFHPPTLYLGFVGFSVPLAFALGAMASKRLDGEWLVRQRPWILFAWTFLSVGNILGMVWAYEELGWGGYWGWDPVENASFMPWLTGTALLHSAMGQERRGILKRWNILLLVLTFALIIFGTFLTRSGVIQSVHSFAGSTTGPYFLALILVILVLGLGLLFARGKPLRPDRPVGDFFSRGSAFLLGNWVFTVAVIFVWTGTMLPFFSQVFTGEQVSVTPAFFNKWMVPIGLVVLALLGFGGSLLWKGPSAKTGTGLMGPAVLGFLAATAAVFAGGINPELGGAMTFAPAVAIGVITFAGTAVLLTLRKTALSARRRKGLFAPTLRRSLGGQISHVAVIVIFIGFTGGGFKVEEVATLAPGDKMMAADYGVRLVGLRWDSNYEREAMIADLEVTNPEGDTLRVLSPAMYRYHSHPGQPTSEVAIDTSPFADVFLVLGEIDEERGMAVIRAVINPLTMWIWIGGAILVLGVLVSLLRPGALVSLVEMGETLRRSLLVPGAVLLAVIILGAGAYLIDGAAFALAALGGAALLALVYFSGRGLKELLEQTGGEK